MCGVKVFLGVGVLSAFFSLSPSWDMRGKRECVRCVALCLRACVCVLVTGVTSDYICHDRESVCTGACEDS